jgi:hypothetical protein
MRFLLTPRLTVLYPDAGNGLLGAAPARAGGIDCGSIFGRVYCDPSEAIEGFAKLPFEAGLTHYDKPPPDVLDDLDDWRRNDRFREANELRAFIEVKDGRIVEFGQLGRGYLGSTTARLGPAHVTFPGVGLPDLRPTPVVEPTSVRFVQTVGGRMGVPMPRPVPRKPYFQIWSAIAWTTLGLTINTDGSSAHELVGASPFPRHWIYDHSGKLAAKSGTIDFKTWFNDSFGEHTPWGDHDSPALATAAETALERQLSQTIMGAGKKPEIRVLNPETPWWSRVRRGRPSCSSTACYP